MSLVVESMPEVSGVTRIAHEPERPGPMLAIVGAIHGNERCGLSAIERLREELTGGALELSAGTLFLVHGNPEATLARTRHTPSGADLNRLFDYDFVSELDPRLWQPEHHRALALRPLLTAVDAVLDLHSTTAPTPPFAIASRVAASEAFALALGLRYVTLGWDGPGLLGDRVLLGPLTRRERPGVAVECGQHDDPRAPEVAYACARAALAYFGMIAERAPEPPEPPLRLAIRAAVKRPSVSFRFERPLAGMERLAPGDVIGHGDHLVLSVRNPCFAIMPNDEVSVGEDMLYIAEELHASSDRA